jgi:hypothetical protein
MDSFFDEKYLPQALSENEIDHRHFWKQERSVFIDVVKKGSQNAVKNLKTPLYDNSKG